MSQAHRSTSPRLADYGQWESALTPAAMFEGSEAPSFPRPGGQGMFFLLSLPEEGNGLALMHLSPAGRAVRVSPPGYNLRSRVHEYGGLPYAAADAAVYYCHYADQCVYRQPFDQASQEAGEPRRLSAPAGDAGLRYGDFLVDAARRRLLCVREDHRAGDGQPRNALVALDLEVGGEGEVLFQDSDFVAAPALSPDGARLAFQTWSQPAMPWDETEIRLARIGPDGRLESLRQVLGEAPGALAQPRFDPAGDLYFIADWSDWWNLYRVPAACLDADCRPAPVFPLEAELCAPQWQLGAHSYDFCGGGQMLISINRRCFWELALLDVPRGQLTPLHTGLGSLEHVFCQQGRALYCAATAGQTAALHGLELSLPGARSSLLYQGRGGVELPRAAVSRPEHLSYATGAHAEAHGLFYAPRNPDFRAPAERLPPLLVSVHGGPTSSARAAYNPALQFWTTRGYAVLDVNHRGSTGYGRRFRHSLYGRWGEADVEDVVNAVRHLIEAGRVDPARIVIRGGSAGGYVVLAALVHSDLFSAGASYYGISDLELLAADTHKFEARYLDQLIGPWPAEAQRYRERSPLHRIDEIHAPVLLLQGGQDKVVPPNQARAIYQALARQAPASRLLEFEDEGHGFRRPANQIAALEAELAFYESVFTAALAP